MMQETGRGLLLPPHEDLVLSETLLGPSKDRCNCKEKVYNVFARWFQPVRYSVFLSQQTSISRAYQSRNQPANRPNNTTIYLYVCTEYVWCCAVLMCRPYPDNACMAGHRTMGRRVIHLQDRLHACEAVMMCHPNRISMSHASMD